MKARIIRSILVILNVVIAVMLLDWAAGFGKWEEMVFKKTLQAIEQSGALDLEALSQFSRSPEWDGPRNILEALQSRGDLMGELWDRVFIPLVVFLLINAILIAGFWRLQSTEVTAGHEPRQGPAEVVAGQGRINKRGENPPYNR